jgi:putative phosphoribosyl transferase
MHPLTHYTQRKLVVLQESDPYFTACKALCEHAIGCVLVCNASGRSSGLVTRGDLICRGLKHRLPFHPERKVHEVMSSPVVGVGVDSSLKDVILLMQKNGYTRIPLLDKDSSGKAHFVGLVTLTDLIIDQQIDTRTLQRILQRKLGRKALLLGENLNKRTRKTPQTLSSQAHRAQTLQRFYSHFSSWMMQPETPPAEPLTLRPDLLPSFIHYCIGFFISRIPFSGATQLLAQLPKLLTEPLLRLPPGPNRSFSLERLYQEIPQRFEFIHAGTGQVERNEGEIQKATRHALHQLISALGHWADPGCLEKLENQLPIEFSTFFESYWKSLAREAEPLRVTTGGEHLGPAHNPKPQESKHQQQQQQQHHSPVQTQPTPQSRLLWNSPLGAPHTFLDRSQAAELLADRLEGYARDNPLILGIPRGAIPMAHLIASRLHGELDTLLVHKIGAPDNPEFAVGSVSEWGDIYRLGAADFYGISDVELNQLAQPELLKLKQRRQSYTELRPPKDPAGRTVILVDDGIATGSTMLAGLRSVRSKHPKKLIVATPVSPPDALERLKKEADEWIVLLTPGEFFSVSQFYENFHTVTDAEVMDHLSQTASTPKAA